VGAQHTGLLPTRAPPGAARGARVLPELPQEELLVARLTDPAHPELVHEEKHQQDADPGHDPTHAGKPILARRADCGLDDLERREGADDLSTSVAGRRFGRGEAGVASV